MGRQDVAQSHFCFEERSTNLKNKTIRAIFFKKMIFLKSIKFLLYREKKRKRRVVVEVVGAVVETRAPGI
jgi:hypothetical protein